PALLEKGAPDARGREERETLHVEGLNEVGQLVRQERLPSRRARARQYPGTAQTVDRSDRHSALRALARLELPDLPRREIHARSAYRAVVRRARHFEHGVEQDFRGG